MPSGFAATMGSFLWIGMGGMVVVVVVVGVEIRIGFGVGEVVRCW